MQAADLISSDVFALKPGDSCAFSREMLSEWHLAHLPVVNEGKLLGIISLRDLIDVPGTRKIDSLLIPLHSFEVNEGVHLFQLIGIFGQTGFTSVPVLDEKEKFKGIITLPHLLNLAGHLLTIEQSGAIITLEMNIMDYALTEISRITENDNVKIMGLLISKLNDAGRIQLHIKLNSWQINGILSAFARYNYSVVAVYTNQGAYNDLKDRYDSLMKYLDI